MSEIEFRDLYDINCNLTGEKIQKGQAVPDGRYYLTVLVFIENDKNEILLQKRSVRKGGKWAATGGHPKSGESSLDGMVTEIKEELGVDVKKDDLKLFKTIVSDDDFLYLYYLKENINIDEIILQEDEVSDVQWFTQDEIETLIKNGEFFKYNLTEYDYFIEYKNTLK